MTQQPSTTTDADADLALLQRILGDAKSGRLRLPSLPDVTAKVRAAVNDPRRSVADIARVVQFDPALAARLIQIANGPLYRGARRFDNCHSAITRLGLATTRNLIVSLTLGHLFQARTAAVRERLQQTWRHSCRVAAISGVLARLTPGVDPDRALLAGLVHDIGVLPLLQYVESMALPGSAERLDTLVMRLAAPLGIFVLKTWQFDPDLAAVPGQVEDWARDSGPRVDYGDIVQVAHIHSRFGLQDGRPDPPLPELKSFRKFNISRLGPGGSLELLEQSQQEISAVLRILQG